MCQTDREQPVAPDIRVPNTPGLAAATRSDAAGDQVFASDAIVDMALEETFPASDPPFCNR